MSEIASKLFDLLVTQPTFRSLAECRPLRHNPRVTRSPYIRLWKKHCTKEI
jgi:hypothetical protein